MTFWTYFGNTQIQHNRNLSDPDSQIGRIIPKKGIMVVFGLLYRKKESIISYLVAYIK